MAKGSGTTYRGVVTMLRVNLIEQYKTALVGANMKPAAVAKLANGFADGFNAAIHHLSRMEVIEVADDPKAEGA